MWVFNLPRLWRFKHYWFKQFKSDLSLTFSTHAGINYRPWTGISWSDFYKEFQAGNWKSLTKCSHHLCLCSTNLPSSMTEYKLCVIIMLYDNHHRGCVHCRDWKEVNLLFFRLLFTGTHGSVVLWKHQVCTLHDAANSNPKTVGHMNQK